MPVLTFWGPHWIITPPYLVALVNLIWISQCYGVPLETCSMLAGNPDDLICTQDAVALHFPQLVFLSGPKKIVFGAECKTRCLERPFRY